MDELLKALKGWVSRYGESPELASVDEAREALEKIQGRLTAWDKEFGQRALEPTIKRRGALEEKLKTLAVRVELVGQPKTTHKKIGKPLLSWSWVKTNVGKGTLFDVLKKALPAYEQSVAAFRKAPERKTLEKAGARLETVEKALTKTAQHYEKKVQDTAGKTKKRDEHTRAMLKGGQAAALLEEAKAEKRALGRLAGKLGDLAPDKVKQDTQGVSNQARTARIQKAQRQIQSEYDLTLEAVPIEREQSLAFAHRHFGKAIKEAEGLDVVPQDLQEKVDEARRKIREFMAPKEEEYQRRLNEAATQREEDLQKLERGDNQIFALASLDWSWIKANFPAKSLLVKALKGPLGDYHKARLALEKKPSAETHRAAHGKLEALVEVFDKLEDAYSKQLKGADNDARVQLTREKEAVVSMGKAVLEHRKELVKIGDELPEAKLVKTLLEEPDGNTLLDNWVSELGGVAKSPSDKAFVSEALKARYGIDRLDGDMTTKALPRLYSVLGMVPDQQTLGNDVMKRIVRKRKPLVPEGFYDHNPKDPDRVGLMWLNVGRTGKTGFQKVMFGLVLPIIEKPEKGWDGADIKAPGPSVVFDHLTLHEMGHAVDEQLGFMQKRLGNKDYGDWRESSASEVKQIAAGQLRFVSDFSPIPKEFLLAYLELVFARKDPKADEALKETWASTQRVWRLKSTAIGQPDQETVQSVKDNKGVKDAEALRAKFAVEGWPPNVADVALQAFTDVTGLTGGAKHLAQRVVDAIILGRKPLDAAVQQVLSELADPPAEDAKPPWNKLAKHPAVSFLKAAKLDPGDIKQVTQWNNKAKKAVAGGRVYQEAYEDTWWSYPVGIRQTGIGGYQFRAPGEWFAEIYANYYVGRLKSSHPDYAWMKALIDTDE
jgi:hypothetical protein